MVNDSRRGAHWAAMGTGTAANIPPEPGGRRYRDPHLNGEE